FKGDTVKESADPRINDSVDEAMARYAKQLKKDFDYFRKTIVTEAEKINSYYLSALNLIPTFATLAAQDKKIIAKNFTGNPLVTSLIQNAELKRDTGKTGSGW